MANAKVTNYYLFISCNGRRSGLPEALDYRNIVDTMREKGTINCFHSNLCCAESVIQPDNRFFTCDTARHNEIECKMKAKVQLNRSSPAKNGAWWPNCGRKEVSWMRNRKTFIISINVMFMIQLRLHKVAEHASASLHEDISTCALRVQRDISWLFTYWIMN